MNVRIISATVLALLGATACAAPNRGYIANSEPAVHGAQSVTSESELNSDNRPAVERSGVSNNPDNSAGLSRGVVSSVYEIQK